MVYKNNACHTHFFQQYSRVGFYNSTLRDIIYQVIIGMQISLFKKNILPLTHLLLVYELFFQIWFLHLTSRQKFHGRTIFNVPLLFIFHYFCLCFLSKYLPLNLVGKYSIIIIACYGLQLVVHFIVIIFKNYLIYNCTCYY